MGIALGSTQLPALRSPRLRGCASQAAAILLHRRAERLPEWPRAGYRSTARGALDGGAGVPRARAPERARRAANGCVAKVPIEDDQLCTRSHLAGTVLLMVAARESVLDTLRHNVGVPHLVAPSSTRSRRLHLIASVTDRLPHPKDGQLGRQHGPSRLGHQRLPGLCGAPGRIRTFAHGLGIGSDGSRRGSLRRVWPPQLQFSSC